MEFLVAKFRIKIGKEIGNAALVADGYHVQVDGFFTGLAVLFGALGVWRGYPLAASLIGLLINYYQSQNSPTCRQIHIFPHS